MCHGVTQPPARKQPGGQMLVSIFSLQKIANSASEIEFTRVESAGCLV